jgi:EAL domain-containing protein (putative c-di-GMP-specific phosphodiesterase class I)
MRDPFIFQPPNSGERRSGTSRQSLASGLQSVLQNSLRRNELFVHYQPRISTTTGKITGMEALVRWQHPHLGMIEPERFIPVAEETGMIAELGEWVLFNALATLKRWQETNLNPGFMAINVSPRQLMDPDFSNMVERLLDITNVPATSVELEITESTRLDDIDQVVRTMKHLEKTGISFAMDDFGAGFASLDYVRRLPVKSVKIDQSFIRNIARSSKDAVMVKGMATLSADLGLKVVAEGIENQDQLDILKPMACDEFQGFLFGRPVANDVATTLLSNAPVYGI